MTSKERFYATIQGKYADRRPFAPILCMYGAKLINVALDRYYQDPALYAAGQAAVVEHFSPDVIISPLYYSGEGESFGSQLRYFTHMPPNIKKMAARFPKDYLRLPFPNIDEQPTLKFIRQSLRLTVEKCGHNVAIGAILANPVDLPSLAMGIDGWVETLLFQTDWLEEIFEKTTRHFVAWGKALVSEGASFLVSSGGFLNSTTVMRSMVETVIAPVLRNAFSQFDVPIVIHDGGGSIASFIDIYKDLPNVVGLYAAATGDDLQKARQMAGNDKTLIGGLDGPTLDKLTVQEIYDKCVAILENRKNDPYFMIGTAGPDIPLATPPENIKAMLQAIKAHGYS
jgi:uroporphyrinogen decarboxylase